MNEDRILLATFCDDIRQEVGYKLSLMGCYVGGELIVDTIPTVLPKLYASIMALSPIAKPFKQLTIRALLNDIVLAENEYPADLLPIATDIIKRKALEDSKYIIHLQIAFIPLIIEKDSILRIEADTEEGVLKGSRLIIRLRQEQDAPITQ